MADTDAIEIYLGEDVELPFSYTPAEDISGWTLLMTVRGSGISLEVDGVIDNAVDGTFTFTLMAEDYETIFRAGSYSYDVWRTDAGSQRCIAAGLFTILAVSRDVLAV